MSEQFFFSFWSHHMTQVNSVDECVGQAQYTLIKGQNKEGQNLNEEVIEWLRLDVALLIMLWSM